MVLVVVLALAILLVYSLSPQWVYDKFPDHAAAAFAALCVAILGVALLKMLY